MLQFWKVLLKSNNLYILQATRDVFAPAEYDRR